MSLTAPIAIPIEVRGPDRRVFRLAARIGEGRIDLERPAPFEPGRPVTVSFALPDGAKIEAPARIALGEDDGDGEAGGRGLALVDPPDAVKLPIRAYVADRLGLPGTR